MANSTAELTVEYIKEHPFVKECLKKELINYSSLARLISKEMNIEKKTSKEAIIMAARRFEESLKEDICNDKKIRDLLANSEIEIKNKMIVFILEKNINLDCIDEIQKKVRRESGTFYILEGSNNYTVITQEKYSRIIENNFDLGIIKKNKNLALINLKSSSDIEQIYGILSYLTSLFAENGVNIIEFLSCWVDTLFIIESSNIDKAIKFLRF